MSDYLLPKEKALKYGFDSLNENELLAIIINSGIKNKSCYKIADELLIKYKSLKDLLTLDIDELKSNEGISINKAILLKSIYYLYIKMDYLIPHKYVKITSASDVYFNYRFLINSNGLEKLYVLYLNSVNEVIKDELLATGLFDSISIDLNVIIKNANINKSNKIILIHNHPHGNSSPSKLDIKSTNLINDKLNKIGIMLVDHVIIGINEYYSIKDNLKVKK